MHMKDASDACHSGLVHIACRRNCEGYVSCGSCLHQKSLSAMMNSQVVCVPAGECSPIQHGEVCYNAKPAERLGIVAYFSMLDWAALSCQPYR